MRLIPVLLASTSLALSSTAMAEITADDVLSNYGAFIQASGMDLNFDAQRDGDVVTLANTEILLEFPLDLGRIRLGVGGVILTEGAGAVGISFEQPQAITFQGNFQEYSFGGVFKVENEGYTARATGVAGDITYQVSADKIRGSLGDLVIPELQLIEMDMSYELRDVTLTSRITEGRLIEVSQQVSIASMAYKQAYSVREDGIEAESNAQGTYGQMVSNASISLPSSGLDYLNISKALRNGMSLQFDGTVASSATSQATYFGTQTVVEQTTNTGPTEQSVHLNGDGLGLDMVVQDFAMSMKFDEIFSDPFDAVIGKLELALQLPINGRLDPQDFRLLYSFRDITMSEDVWQLFDPGTDISRDAATLHFDISGSVISSLDLLDYDAVVAAVESAEVPFEFQQLTLNDLDVSAAGVALSGAGSFVFDNTDLETFFGFPRPEGSANFRLAGANGMVSRLVDMGLFNSDEAMGFRMGLAFVGNSTGEDIIESLVEITPEGHLMVNGQRMQ